MKYYQDGNRFMLCLESGEKLKASIDAFAAKMGITTAKISGIGAVCDVNLLCYDVDTKIYSASKFSGRWELVSLVGNIVISNGIATAHLHASLANDRGGMRGGHLSEAEITVTGEIFIETFTHPIERLKLHNVGMRTWNLPNNL